MSFVIADRVRETTQTIGTGSVFLQGALGGYKPFSTIGNGNSTYYVIVLGSQWEVGIGTYSSSTNTLSRDTVLSSANNDNLVNFASGIKDVVLSQPAERAVYVDGATLVASNNAILPVVSGGTGASTAANALTNLGAYSASNPSGYTSNTGTVTSVAVSGGTTGLTTSGGPVTTSGTVTLAGTLAVANGGTGTTTPSLVAGTNVTISGSWPNQTVNASGGVSLIGVTESFPTGELTALGFSAGASSFGLGSTFIGYNAGRVNSSGYDNTALGTNAMWANTSGFKNTAIGAGALFANTNGDNNIAIGNALFQSPGGDNNIAIGDWALRSTSGNDVYSCVAIGIMALRDNTTGMDNTAIGHFAGYLNGVNSNTTGNNNTFIGNGAVGASQTASNAITLGNSSIATLRCQVTTITSLSDARDKTNIMDIPAGLSFVQALRPVAFDWNMRDGGKIGVREFGFIAQELQAAQTQTGITVPNLLYTDNPEKLEASAGTLIPVLVKAIQELKTQLDAVKSEIALLRNA
jgi:hypothetical protein